MKTPINLLALSIPLQLLLATAALADDTFVDPRCTKDQPVQAVEGKFHAIANSIQSFNYSQTHAPNQGTNLVEIVYTIDPPIKVADLDWNAVQISFRPSDNPPVNRFSGAKVQRAAYRQCGYFHFVGTTDDSDYCETVQKTQTCNFTKDDVLIEFDPQHMDWYKIIVQPKPAAKSD